MNWGAYTARKDLQFPCKGCPKKTAICRDSCQDPEFLRVRQAYKKLRETNAAADEARRYDALSQYRRSRKK